MGRRNYSKENRCRIVELVREPGGQSAQRLHFFVVKVAGRKLTRAIGHDVHERRRDVIAIPDQIRKFVALDRHDLSGLVDDRIAGRFLETRIRQHAGHVTGPPFHDTAAAGAAIDVDVDDAGEHDVQPFNGPLPRRQQLTGRELPDAAVRRDPLELLARRAANRTVRDQPIDQRQ